MTSGEGNGVSQSQPILPSNGQPEAEPSAAGRKLYVVCGSTGEYSDRSEWTTWAFDTEAEARAYVEFLTAKRQSLGISDGDWDDRDRAELAMRAFDPGYSEDYTGTSWFVSYVDYGPPPSSETPASGSEAEGDEGNPATDEPHDL